MDILNGIYNIVPIEKNNLKKVAEMLSIAFYDDPLYRYFTPNDKLRGKNSYNIFTFVLNHGVKYGKIISESENINAMLLWYPPNNKCFELISQVKCGALALPFKIGFNSLMRAYNYSQIIELLHNKYLKEIDYYLYILAVTPENQGKGYSSIMMRYFLEQIDFNENRVYLETSNPKNIPIYEHYGFKIKEEVDVPGQGIKIWPMVKT